MPYSTLVTLIHEGKLKQVKDYVQKHPESVKEKNEETGQIALHYAFIPFALEGGRTVVALEKIRFLLDKYPEGIAQKDKSGQLPLHVFVSLFIRGERMRPLLQILLELFPVATRIRDSNGHFPLHCAIKTRNFAMAEYLLDHHVGDIDVRGVKGVLPPLLCFAFKYRAPIDFIRSLLEKAPSCATSIDDEVGCLALHEAVLYCLPLDQVQLILNANPSALRHQCKNGGLPLHLEARNGGRNEVLTVLIDGYPDGIRVSDKNGAMPIHAACQNKTITVESLEVLNNAYPEVLNAKCKAGWTILHRAFHKKDGKAVSETTVGWVLEKCPESMRVATNKNCLPLHFAARSPKCPLSVLQLLIDKYPEALRMKEKNGNLPLHCMLYKGGSMPLENVQLLLDDYPQAALLEPNKFGLLPLHIACAKNVSFAVASLLVKSCPQARGQYDKAGRLPIHWAIQKAADASIVKLLFTSEPADGGTPKKDKFAHPLLFACEKDASLDVIRLLVRNSLELLPGSIRSNGNDNGKSTLSCAESLRSRRKRHKLT